MSAPDWIGCPVNVNFYGHLGWVATVSEPGARAFKALFVEKTLDELCVDLVANGVFDEVQMADVRRRVLERDQMIAEVEAARKREVTENLRALAQSLGPVVGPLADPSWDGQYGHDDDRTFDRALPSWSYEDRLEVDRALARRDRERDRPKVTAREVAERLENTSTKGS